MPLRVAEYLGKNTRRQNDILPTLGDSADCPFCGAKCTKLKKGLKPVCAVRKDNGLIWVVCTNRLVAANRDNANSELKELVRDIAGVVFPGVPANQVLYANQRGTAVFGPYRINLDYVLYCQEAGVDGHRKVILEIQGGGETSNTGKITKHVDAWEKSDSHHNAELSKPVSKANVIPNNAWKRQLEQIIRKTRYGKMVNAGFALAMGELLYSYVDAIIAEGGSSIQPDWDVCFIELKEANVQDTENYARFGLGRRKYMTYDQFFYALSKFPIKPDVANLFVGEYSSLLGVQATIAEDPDPIVAQRRREAVSQAIDPSIVIGDNEEHDEAEI